MGRRPTTKLCSTPSNGASLACGRLRPASSHQQQFPQSTMPTQYSIFPHSSFEAGPVEITQKLVHRSSHREEKIQAPYFSNGTMVVWNYGGSNDCCGGILSSSDSFI